MLTLKDLSAEMLLHPRTVKRWWKRLGVSPYIAGHGSHRWTRAQADSLMRRWRAYWLKKSNRLDGKQLYRGQLGFKAFLNHQNFNGKKFQKIRRSKITHTARG